MGLLSFLKKRIRRAPVVQTKHTISFEFEDGDILFVRNQRSWIGRFIRTALGDFDYEHVCQWFKGNIYTTGQGGFPRYAFGRVPAHQYLKNKHIAVGRYQQLTDNEKQIMHEVATSLCGRAYPWWKVLTLVIQGKLSARVVQQVGFKANPNPTHVFCAAAVALGFLKAGLIVTDKYIKLEPDAYTPETLYDSSFIDILHRQSC